jgi:hypothetical protein
MSPQRRNDSSPICAANALIGGFERAPPQRHWKKKVRTSEPNPIFEQ